MLVTAPSVFIIYSSQDLAIAKAIENHLLGNKLDDVWLDKRTIDTDWCKDIENELSKKDIVLLIWSEYLSKSE
jgi:predicted nucleotide-binding protein